MIGFPLIRKRRAEINKRRELKSRAEQRERGRRVRNQKRKKGNQRRKTKRYRSLKPEEEESRPGDSHNTGGFRGRVAHNANDL